MPCVIVIARCVPSGCTAALLVASLQVFEHFKKKEGAKLETVIKVEEDEAGSQEKGAEDSSKTKGNHSATVKESHSDHEDHKKSQSEKKKKKPEKAGVMSVLIDSHGNKYVLAEPAKKTVTRHDWHLLLNLCLVVGMAFVLGWSCQRLGVPALFGYVLSGVIVGPPGFNMVQVIGNICADGFFMPL